MRCEHAREAGTYVLGSLAPAERTMYERHLAVCPVCREAVAEIAVLPGLLGRLDAAAATQIVGGDDGIDAPESRLPRLIDAAARFRRKEARVRRLRMAGVGLATAGVALVFSLGIGPVGGLVHSPSTTQPSVALAAMRAIQDTPVTAEVGFAQMPGGTEVVMHCKYPESPSLDHSGTYVYRLFAVGVDGSSEQVGSWLAGPGTNVTVPGVTRIAYKDLSRFELKRGDGTTLLVYDVT
jgi:hypothetical protein